MELCLGLGLGFLAGILVMMTSVLSNLRGISFDESCESTFPGLSSSVCYWVMLNYISLGSPLVRYHTIRCLQDSTSP